MNVVRRLRNISAKVLARALKKSGLFESYFGQWRQTFPIFEKLGVHVLPVHYYSPVPNTASLPDSLWESRSSMPGVDMNEDNALALLDTFAREYKSEFSAWPFSKEEADEGFYLENTAYSIGDAEILYSFLRHFKPKKMIEIGSGFSTFVSSMALQKNKQEDEDYDCDFVAIEPYPPEYLKDGLPGLKEMIDQPLEDVPLERFEALDEGDVLFIDSSHVLRIGSDVQYEYLEILPRLRPGILVHIHDIYLPAQYPRRWTHETRYFWNEQYLLQAFLAFNERFEVLWPGHSLHLNHADKMNSLLPHYEKLKVGPSCFWMRTK